MQHELWMLLCCVALLAPATAAADLTGHWRFRYGESATGLTDVAQVGDTLTFTMTNQYGGLSSFTATANYDRRYFVGRAPASPPDGCELGIELMPLAGEAAIRGRFATFASSTCAFSNYIPVHLDRCECFDGNSADGDGCDRLCRVEPCYQCTGEPSVCTAQPDGAACEDGDACTSGETCSALLCGGGSAVNPCVDLSGRWTLHFIYFEVGVEFDAQYVFTQRNTELEIQVPNGFLAGSVDPATGTFGATGFYDPYCAGQLAADGFGGQVTLDGLTITGGYTEQLRTSVHCDGFVAAVSGSRCGVGTVDGNEECDDGNRTDGDGCDASCRVEPCFACSGSPSTCATLPDATSCDDDEPCTTSGVCQAGICMGTPLLDGTPCSDEEICTQGDACAHGVCTGTALQCGSCELCDGITPACIPRPDFTPCDDGNACTEHDYCAAGVCDGPGIPCSYCYQCDEGQCVAAPLTGCVAAMPSRAMLSMRNTSAAEHDSLAWYWRRGEGSGLPELNDPTRTYYTVCVYDESTSPPGVLFAHTPPHYDCPGPCWTPVRQGFRYRNTIPENSGITHIDLRAKRDGRAKIVLRGKGIALDPPRAPLSLPLRLQLQARDSLTGQQTTCYEAEFAAPGVRTNADGVFRARGTGP